MRGSIPAFLPPHLGCSTYNMESASSFRSFPLPSFWIQMIQRLLFFRIAQLHATSLGRYAHKMLRPAHRLLLRFLHHSQSFCQMQILSVVCFFHTVNNRSSFYGNTAGVPRTSGLDAKNWISIGKFRRIVSPFAHTFVTYRYPSFFLPLLRLLESLFHKKHTIPGCGMQRCTALWYRSRRSRKHGRPTGIRK